MSAVDYVTETLEFTRAALAPQPTTEAGRLYRDYLEGVEMGVFGDWRTGAPRPGQWGERAHRRRAKRRTKAANRRALTRARRAAARLNLPAFRGRPGWTFEREPEGLVVEVYWNGAEGLTAFGPWRAGR